MENDSMRVTVSPQMVGRIVQRGRGGSITPSGEAHIGMKPGIKYRLDPPLDLISGDTLETEGLKATQRRNGEIIATAKWVPARSTVSE